MKTLTEETAEGIMPMIVHIAKKIYQLNQIVPLEDLIGEGNLALARAAKRFTQKKGVKLSTFAYRHISGSMLDLQEKYINHAKRVTYDDPDNTEPLVDLDLEHDNIRHQLTVKMVQVLERELPEEQSLILVRHYFEGLSFDVISREMTTPRSVIESLHKRALRTLHRLLAEDN